MRIYIEIVDLVANALIELVEKKEQREVLFSQLDEYGAKVIEALNQEEKSRAVLVVSRESQMALVDDYTEFFESYCSAEGAPGIRLRDGKEPIDLWRHFCASFSTKVIWAFQVEQATKALGL